MRNEAIDWPEVESCTNLATHNWQPFGSTAIGNGLTNVLSVAASESPARFFKICCPNP